MTIRIRPIVVRLSDQLDTRGLAALLTPSLLDSSVSDDAPEAMPTAKPGTGWLRWETTQRVTIPGLD
jgi:hypothetical protein